MVNQIADILIKAALAFSLLYTIAAVVFLAFEKWLNRKFRRANNYCPPVSIFKPLKGLDNGLETNLRSFFELAYPQYELLFGVKDYNDPAIKIVRKLQAKYPHVESRLVVNCYQVGINPKVNNLYNMYEYARYDHFVISDSNIRVRPDYLHKLLLKMTTSEVGLVTSTIRGTGAANLGAALENLHLNTYIAASVVIVTRLFRVPVTIGKSMLIRRDTLENLGGFQAFSRYLLEDGLLGRSVKKLGLAVVTSVDEVDNITTHWDIKQFWSRHLRWSTMRRRFNLPHYIAEILSNPILLALVNLVWQPNGVSLLLFLATIIIKVSMDMITAGLMHARDSHRYFFLIPLKDLMIAAVWLVPFFRTKVNWRGNNFKVLKDTIIVPIHAAAGDGSYTGFDDEKTDQFSPGVVYPKS